MTKPKQIHKKLKSLGKIEMRLYKALVLEWGEFLAHEVCVHHNSNIFEAATSFERYEGVFSHKRSFLEVSGNVSWHDYFHVCDNGLIHVFKKGS